MYCSCWCWWHRLISMLLFSWKKCYNVILHPLCIMFSCALDHLTQRKIPQLPNSRFRLVRFARHVSNHLTLRRLLRPLEILNQEEKSCRCWVSYWIPSTRLKYVYMIIKKSLLVYRPIMPSTNKCSIRINDNLMYTFLSWHFKNILKAEVSAHHGKTRIKVRFAMITSVKPFIWIIGAPHNNGPIDRSMVCVGLFAHHLVYEFQIRNRIDFIIWIDV